MKLKTKMTPLGGYSPPYKKGFILFESSVPGIYTLEIKKCLLDIWISGGGGGGANGPGGTGGTLHIRIRLESGTYTLTIGTPGNGAAAYVRNNNGYPGGLSSIVGLGTSIVANGGIGRNGRRNGGGGGTVGVSSYNLTNVFEILFQAQSGIIYALSYITNDSSGPGAGGIAQGNDEGRGYNGQPGYIKIVFIK